jgi:thymidylate synthase (FAD)
MTRKIRIITEEPTVEIIAEMAIDWHGVKGMAEWVKDRRPECLPDYEPISSRKEWEEYWYGRDTPPESVLFPHYLEREEPTIENTRNDNLELTSNALLAELAGRKCYDSFGEKAGRKSNKEYIAHTQEGEIPHASILYHAKFTFFFAGISRRVSQEMMRNYVGSDRDQEGSPSQESTRYTEQTGVFIAHPRIIGDETEMLLYRADMQEAYDSYLEFMERQVETYKDGHGGAEPKGMDRKRIYEAAIGRLPWDFETSFIWTTNPVALMKIFRERCDSAADLEFQRFAKKLRRVCFEREPNLFPKLTQEIVYG